MASKPKIVMKRALRGLYDGRHIQFGNKISEDGGNKTRRSWKPNRQKKRLFSIGLDRYVWLDVTTHALRCMDRAGGLDEYLLKIPERKLHSERLLYLRSCIAGSYKKLGDSMLPPDLEKKIKAVMEWGLQAKGKDEKEAADEEGSEPQELAATETDDDYLNEMFSRVKLGEQRFGSYPQGELARMARISPGGHKEPGASSSDSRPRPEEFPESLFSDVVS